MKTVQIDAKDKLYEEYNALSVNNITLSLCTNLLVSKEEYAAGSTSRHRLKNFTCFLQTKSSLTLGFFSFSVSILLYYGFQSDGLQKIENVLHVSNTEESVETRE